MVVEVVLSADWVARGRYFMWDLNGYLVLESIMDAEWLAAAHAAVDWHYTSGLAQDAHEMEDDGQHTHPTRCQGTRRPTGFGELLSLPHPHCEP